MDLFFSEISAAVLRKRQAEGFNAGACGVGDARARVCVFM
jgi:hypothetical protein